MWKKSLETSHAVLDSHFKLSCFSLQNTGRNLLSNTNPNLLFDTNVFEFNCKMIKFKRIAIKYTFRVQLIYCDENSYCYLVHPLPPSSDWSVSSPHNFHVIQQVGGGNRQTQVVSIVLILNQFLFTDVHRNACHLTKRIANQGNCDNRVPVPSLDP